MSFRTRLTLFFVLLVVVPMVALGVVVVRLVSDSEHGKASARGGAFATVASESYRRSASRGVRQARILAADQQLVVALREGDAAAARRRAAELTRNLGLARVSIVLGSADSAPTAFVDLGDRTAIAGGAARIRTRTGGLLALVEASTTSAAAFVRATAVGGVRIAVLRDGLPLAAESIPASVARTLATTRNPDRAALAGTDYAVTTFRTADFGDSTDTIAVLSPITSANGAVARGRLIAIGLLALFLILAFIGALRISRQLTGQLQRFLTAARRIGDGDFSTKVPVEGDDEFAALGREFNKMSRELEQRLAELDREQSRLRESIQRIGATFAAKLDRFALLEIGTQTVVDAVGADCGRATVQTSAGGDLLECARVGEVDDAEQAIAAAETYVRSSGKAAAATHGGVSALAAPIPRAADEPGIPQGILAVARSGSPFGIEELELAGSLARQTGLSLENVELHDEVKRQAVTDELTGLFNHGRFQQVIAAETAAAQRFGQPLGLLMLDVDDFKRVNDTYGHPQGDLVLRRIAQVLRDASREIDEPARYGGEEMIVALPQTDLDGAEVIAERVRSAVEALELPRLDGGGTLHVTVSCGVAASAVASKEALIAAADDALYRAKRAGKNRTVRADDPANAPVPVQETPR